MKIPLREATIIVFLLVLNIYQFTQRWDGCGGTTADTTAVQVKPPAPQTTTGIPAQVVTKIVYRDRTDSTALMESAWLQNEVATLNDSVDSLLARNDSLKARLTELLAPHTAVTPFSFVLLEGSGWLKGTAAQAYAPLRQQFGLSLTPTELYIPQITITKKPAWWVKPAMFVGGAATIYFVQRDNSTGALISGGASTIILFGGF